MRAPAAAPRPAGDQGSGTVLTLAAVAVVVVLAAATGVLAGAQSGRLTAQAAADLAALAAAGSIAAPPGVVVAGRGTGAATPCDLAVQVVARNRADLAGCRVLAGGVVEVVAHRSTVAGRATATARAGPSPRRG